MLLLLLLLLPLLSQFWVLLVEAALFRDKNPRVGCHITHGEARCEAQSIPDCTFQAGDNQLLPKDGFGCPERPSRQAQLQADSTAGLGCHEGCGNALNTMTTGSLDGNLG